MWSSENQMPSDDDGEYHFPDLLKSDEAVNVSQIPPAPKNLWVVKDANSNGAGGIWIVGPQNAKEFQESTTPLLEEHRYVAQRYAWPPVLYDGRKCHVRVYGLMTCDGRAFVHKRAFLHVANEPFLHQSNESEFLASKHITNCCANSHDELKFAGEICADMEATDFSELGGQTVVPLADFFLSISASVAELSRQSFLFLRGGEANNGFEYLGMDFILSYDANNEPVAYMLEVNAPPSQDTATGLPHAETLHDDVIRDILTLWVFPKVTGHAIESPGGWKCVYDGRGDNMRDTSIVVPSKAAILNKIRWAIYERKNSKIYDETEKSSARVLHGKNDHGLRETLSAAVVATFARSQFPYFADNEEAKIVSSSSLRPAQIFFENAGGSQVPYQVIQAVSSSLSYRNRCVNGQKSMEAARCTISTILGANVDEHLIFLGANASSLFEQLAHKYVQSGLLSRNDEIIVSTENHLANVTPWLSAAQTVGAKVKWWHVEGPDFGMNRHISVEGPSCRSHDLRELLSSRTRVLAVSNASNVIGEARDLNALCELAKKRTNEFVQIVVDGVAAVPHVSPSLSDSGVDWYGISCHKLFGPHVGALCGRKAVVKLLDPIGNHSCDEDLYQILENGTSNYEACAGVHGLGRYFRALARFTNREHDETLVPDPLQTRNQCTESRCDRHEDLRQTHCSNEVSVGSEDFELNERDVSEAYKRIRISEAPLVELLHTRLKSCGAVRIIASGTASLAKLPVFSFLHRFIPSSVIVRKCHDHGIVCRQSSFLSTVALQEYYGFGSQGNDNQSRKDDGVVRVSLAHYNKASEVEFLMDTLESLPQWWRIE
jgi:selenocysteine lyase/cysteine desulfurase